MTPPEFEPGFSPWEGDVKQGELARVKARIADKLKNGPVLATEIEKQAREANISESTLKRAKGKSDVQSKKDGPNGEWRWHLVQEGKFRRAKMLKMTMIVQKVVATVATALSA